MQTQTNQNSGNLSEQELMTDLLTSEKQAISAYSTGITESSCTNLRDHLVENFKSTQEIQYRVFDAMKQRGWYKTDDAQTQKVQEAKQKASQLCSEIQ